MERPTATRLPSLFLLKSGLKKPAVFMAPGLGANVTQFSHLVQYIRSDHAIYGVEPRGCDGSEEPFDRVEHMAEHYLRAIKEVQPHGPYFFVGYSFGGLVMLEMAHRLSESGERVALLALVETFPHPRHLPVAQRARLLMTTARHHLSIAMRLSMPEGLVYMFSPSARQSGRYDNNSEDLRIHMAELASTPAMQRVRDSSYEALSRYRPRPYKGGVKFVKATVSSYFPDDAVAVWAHLIERFEVETLPGDHQGIIRTRFEDLAALLSRYLRESVSNL